MDQNTYFNSLPLELLSEILLYLDINEIKEVTTVSRLVQIIIESKIFWINKLTFDKMDEYISFLGTFSDYFKNYNRFMLIERDIIYFTKKFNGYGGNVEFAMSDDKFRIHNAYILFYISDDINVKEMIDYNLEKFSRAVKTMNVEVLIENIKEKYTYALIKPINQIIENGELTQKEFKLLLIKLSLVGMNIFDLSNWEEIINDIYEWIEV